MDIIIRLVASISVVVAVFMGIQALMSAAIRSRAPKAAIAQAQILEGRRLGARRKVSTRDRIKHFFADRGYSGSLGPVVVGGLLAFVVATLALSFIGFGGVIGLLVALVVVTGGTWLASARIASKRKSLFDRQLAEMLFNLASQLEGGTGVIKALESAAASFSDPLGPELDTILNAVAVSTDHDLTPELEVLGEKYPSRGMSLFIAAYVMSTDGGQLAPALKQAAATIRRDFELVDEANAEIAQTRFEYYGLVSIIGFIAWMLVFANDSTATAFRTPVGIAALLVGTVWFVIGMVIVSLMLNRVGGSRSAGPARKLLDSRAKDAQLPKGSIGEELR